MHNSTGNEGTCKWFDHAITQECRRIILKNTQFKKQKSSATWTGYVNPLCFHSLDRLQETSRSVRAVDVDSELAASVWTEAPHGRVIRVPAGHEPQRGHLQPHGRGVLQLVHTAGNTEREREREKCFI